MRDTFKYKAYFPSNIEKSSESEINFSEIEAAFTQVDWSVAFEKASLIYDHPEVKYEHETPYFQVVNLEDKHELTFIVARNEALENKITVFFNYPEEKTSLFGLMKKEVQGGFSALLEDKVVALKIMEAFEKKDYAFIKGFEVI